MFLETIAAAPFGIVALLIVSLGVALTFECINGFHDAANAVVGVIYTRALRPTTAVVFSGVMNFIGVSVGGIGVAYSIVHLLPVDLLVSSDRTAAFAMIGALLLSATIWNFGTWYFGLPASSSHALIGAIIGVGFANAAISGGSFQQGVNWGKAGEVLASLVVSPVIGFAAAAMAILALRRLVDPGTYAHFYQPPRDHKPPKRYVREVLVLCCGGISFAHGSNDGQKGMGLIMLILIGLFPAVFALDTGHGVRGMADLRGAAQFYHRYLTERQVAIAALVATGHPAATQARAQAFPVACGIQHAIAATDAILRVTEGIESLSEVAPTARWSLRTEILCLDDALNRIATALPPTTTEEAHAYTDWQRALRKPIEYVPDAVKVAVALALGLGTMIGWRRIVVTVGEKIGRNPMTYAQGTAAQAVTAGTIALADVSGLPVSTTHVLSSAVAGTMAAERHGLQLSTLKSIVLAWVTTLPATMLLSAGIYASARALLG